MTTKPKGKPSMAFEFMAITKCDPNPMLKPTALRVAPGGGLALR